MTGVVIGVVCLQVPRPKGCWQLLEARGEPEMDSPSHPKGEPSLATSLVLDTGLPDCERINLCCKPRSLWCFVTAVPGNSVGPTAEKSSFDITGCWLTAVS